MTKRERAAHAAKWREIASRVERLVEVGGQSEYQFLCWHAADMYGLDHEEVSFGNPAAKAPILLFRPHEVCGAVYWIGNDANDCRVIAAGLIAAMYETGEFDD